MSFFLDQFLGLPPAQLATLNAAAQEATPLLSIPIAGGITVGAISSTTAPLVALPSFFTNSTIPTTIISYTGKGILEFLSSHNSGTGTGTLTLTIDGVSVYSGGPGANSVIAVVGAVSTVATNQPNVTALGAISFKSSLVITHAASASGASTTHYKYRKTA